MRLKFILRTSRIHDVILNLAVSQVKDLMTTASSDDGAKGLL